LSADSLFVMMSMGLSAPDHTTLSRRGKHLDITLRRIPAGEAIHLIVDSTGLSIVGEGEWAAAKHGCKGKRGWRKLHRGVDRTAIIVAQALTGGNADDAATVRDPLSPSRKLHFGAPIPRMTMPGLETGRPPLGAQRFPGTGQEEPQPRRRPERTKNAARGKVKGTRAFPEANDANTLVSLP